MIYEVARTALTSLGLAHLNARPYDNAFSVFHSDKAERKFVVVGFNGSDADLDWTNIGAIEHGYNNPHDSNVLNGANGGWLSTTLPKRLIELPDALGFSFSSTIYTNAILLCSKDAKAVKSKAKMVGFESVDELVEKSLDFFKYVTLAQSEPELILCYGNSMTDLSAASVLYNRFGDGQIYESNDNVYYKTFSFLSKIEGRPIPVVCVRHMSRFKPCYESIRAAWKYQTDKICALTGC